jgi:hypothetical protein
MGKIEVSTKRTAISKANAQMVAVVAVASFVTIFCLFAAKAAWSLNRYQAKVTTAEEKAKKQLQANSTAFKALSTSYAKFDKKDPNIIGRSSTGSGDNEGKNSRVILDALPSSYDFPALASSLEKMLVSPAYKLSGISGTDDQLNQQGNLSSPTPTAVSIPFTFTISNASYDSLKGVVAMTQNSIRPIQIDSMTVSGGGSSMTLSISAHTYYQPAKDVDIKKQVVK